ncbi:transglycosylase SLT domain-containing protein [Streptomyces sp. NPDC051569]|uniref:transglycosylase SLT domain-containing protein n=1 Tax=Streptomyces sp. NPDC051569 TaxID=3365661 RepID=UPI0037A77B58
MPTKGKHRRPGSSPLARRLVAAGTGSAALALPLIAATTAEAAPQARQVSAHPVTAVTAAAAKETALREAPATHLVVRGDSLSKIAEAHALSGGWKKLYQDNRRAVGGNPSLIHPGLTLVLGEKAAPRTAAPRTAAPSAAGQKAAPAATESGPTADGGAVVQAAEKTYSDDLDGWIRESLDIMAAHGIPGSYDGIHRNIMRESSGNPSAINNWDSNAAAGTPSKGLLQVIDPTFQAYHVPGTSMDSYDPVANITAACNYAAARYGSIDNVNGPY